MTSDVRPGPVIHPVSSLGSGRLVAGLLWGLLGLLLIVTAWWSLTSCGLGLPGHPPLVSWCRIPEDGTRDRLADLTREREALLRDLAARSRAVEGLSPCPQDCLMSGSSQPLDVYLLLDVSGSFNNDMENITTAMADLAARARAGALPSGFRLGLGAFSDKPITPFGQPRVDFTYRPVLPLTRDIDLAAEAVQSLRARMGHGGQRDEEAQLEAMIEALGRMTEIGFNPDGRKLLVVITDAPAMEAGSWSGAPGPEDGQADGDPLNEDYPSPDQVKARLHATDVEPVFLVSGPEAQIYYSALVQRFGRGQVVPITSTSEGLVGALLDGLSRACRAALSSVSSPSGDTAPR